MNRMQIQQMIDDYLQAERALLQGKSIEFKGRKLESEDLNQLRQGRQEWERKLNQLNRGNRPAVVVFNS